MIDRTVSRRGFVTTVAAATVGSWISTPRARWSIAAALGNENQAEPIRLGVASYSLRNFTREQAIEVTHALGADDTNVKSVHLPYGHTRAGSATANAELAAAGLQVEVGRHRFCGRGFVWEMNRLEVDVLRAERAGHLD